MEKLSRENSSFNIIDENIKTLKSIFPEAFSEDGINFEILRQLLGDNINEDQEKYSFTWHGKKKARQIALTPSLGTLRPCKKESVDWDTTKNLFIEGDNLEVLKLLQKSYANKIKMIYIDPPYNTGKDFVYKDKFKDYLENYLKQTGQKTSEGLKTSSNPETSGRYHTNWLNMMYPRLKLARSLLKENGVIFISIDDHEVANLRKICDEIFGEENFLAQFIWKRRVSSGLSQKNISTDHEYVICYQKNISVNFIGIKKDFKKYSNPDNDPRGPWILDNLTVGMSASIRPNQAYDLIDPKTGIVYPFNPNRVWAFIPETMNKMIAENKIFFPNDISKRPMQKRFKSELKNKYNPFSTIMINKVGLNLEATRITQEIFGSNIFEYSKPISLIKILISQPTKSENDIVLDFFAGSCTTAHATLNLNKKDNGNRRFIMVQLPEKTNEKSQAFKAGYKNIADIGKERIRRAAKKIKEEDPQYKGDLGFKVFKLDTSNIRAWNSKPDNLTKTLFDNIDHIVEDRSDEDVLYELLLTRGVDLTIPIKKKMVKDKTIYNIGKSSLFVCLDNKISKYEYEELAIEIIKWRNKENKNNETLVIFKDTAFKDNVIKSNLIEILKQNNINHIRSL